MEAIKTRLGPCWRQCYLQHFYDTGINYHSGYFRLLSQRNYFKPKNKQQFWAFNQTTLVDKDGKEINENKAEDYLKKHPEMLFDSYPEYCVEEESVKGNKKVEAKEKSKKTD